MGTTSAAAELCIHGPSADARIAEVLVHTLSFLEPSNLISVSLVSRRFNALTNSPHSWRAAFSRYFPAPFHELGGHEVTQDRRYFTPLSLSTGAHAWRNEYTQRTTLLRSLGKGKLHAPDGLSRAGQGSGGLMVTYPSVTGQTSVSHMAANFAPSGVRCVHASLESQYVSASDGITGMQYPAHVWCNVDHGRQTRETAASYV